MMRRALCDMGVVFPDMGVMDSRASLKLFAFLFACGNRESGV